jgi:ankyrin repeat protein
VNPKRKINCRTPLYYACQKGSIEIVQLLLNYKADVNVQDENGDTPLYSACLNKHPEIVKLLINNNANVNAQNKNGSTPLHTACLWEYYEIAVTLIKSLIKPTLDWNQKRILFIGHLKEDPKNCHFANLPAEMILHVLAFCGDKKQNISALKQLIECKNSDNITAFQLAPKNVKQKLGTILDPQSWADEKSAEETYDKLILLIEEMDEQDKETKE